MDGVIFLDVFSVSNSLKGAGFYVHRIRFQGEYADIGARSASDY